MGRPAACRVRVRTPCHRATSSALADTRLQRLLLGLELRVERRAAGRAHGQRQRRRRRPRERLARGRRRRRRRVHRRGRRHKDRRAAALRSLGRLARGLLLARLRAAPAARAPQRPPGAPSILLSCSVGLLLQASAGSAGAAPLVLSSARGAISGRTAAQGRWPLPGD